jgi:hypothetical protein
VAAVIHSLVLVVCDEARRRELIEQRQRLLEAESEGKVIELNGHKTEAVVPVTPETQPNASADAGNGIVAQNSSPVTQKDPLILKMESIGRAESWKSEPEHHGGNFGPYPEEFE